MQAFVRLAQLREPERFVPWLRQIVLNACRLQRRRRRLIDPLDAVEHQRSPEGDADRWERRVVLHEAPSRLSPPVRLAVELFFLGGESYHHTAAWNGHTETSLLLHKHGASLDARDDRHRATPRDWAEFNGQHETARFLDEIRRRLVEQLPKNS